MQKPENGTSKAAAPFLMKTYALLENPAYETVVRWSPTVLNSDEMATKVLPAYFKSQNLCSFIRQLNTYGFHKVDGDARLEFKHELFVRGKQQQLVQIQRRKSVKRETEDMHHEERKAHAPAPTPVSPVGSESSDPHRSPFVASPSNGVPLTPLSCPALCTIPLAPGPPLTAMPACPAQPADVNHIAQIGSILQKILVELERVKREQASLRQVVDNMQGMHISQPPVHVQVPAVAIESHKVDHILDVAGDLHRSSLEQEPNWDFDAPYPIDELLGEVLQLDVPAPSAHSHSQLQLQ